MKTIKKILIFPFNGNGIEALDGINDGEFEFLGFIDDNPEKRAAKNKWPVFTREILLKEPDSFVLAVPGSPVSFTRRKEFIDSLAISPDRFVSVIHPSASIGKDVSIGMNCLIMAGVVITSNARIGNHVCILPNTVIHHDAIVNDYSLIGSNVAIAGGTVVGRNCYIGSGTNLMNGISIGEYSLVGLGSNVLKSIPDHSKVAGNPARPLNKNQ